MSAEVSRRLGRVAHLIPFDCLTPVEQGELDTLAFQAKRFGDLPERYQQVLLAAEATRARLIAEQQSSVSA